MVQATEPDSTTTGAAASAPPAAQPEPQAGREPGLTPDRRTPIVEAARRVTPSVVSVNVIRRQRVGPRSFFEDFFAPFGTEREVAGLGSGFAIAEGGYVLTNAHVVQGAIEIVVSTVEGGDHPAELIGSDELSDVALLQVNAEIPVPQFGDSDDLVIGEPAIAIGNPFGYLLRDRQPTVTVGVISALHRDVKPERGQFGVYKDMIQTDAAINPGNSGGPLVNCEGEVVGINSFIFTKSGGSLGMGFAIPINTVRRIMGEFIRYGRIRPVWVGVQVQEITPLLALSLDLETTEGVLVSHVDRGSPADVAGVERGDLLQAIGRERIRSVDEAQRALADAIVGDEVEFRLVRRDQVRSAVLRLVERPEEGSR